MKEVIDQKLDIINNIIDYHTEVFKESDFDVFRDKQLVDQSIDKWNIKNLFYLTVAELENLYTKLQRY